MKIRTYGPMDGVLELLPTITIFTRGTVAVAIGWLWFSICFER